MFRRRALIFLLALGTVTGYASGFASLHRWHPYGPGGDCHRWSGYGYGYNPGPPANAWAPQAPQAPRPAEAPPATQAAPQAPAQAPSPEPR